MCAVLFAVSPSVASDAAGGTTPFQVPSYCGGGGGLG